VRAKVAIRAVIFSLGAASAAYAGNCTPPAEEYIGIVMGDGECQPWPKKLARYASPPYCEPNLEGRGEWTQSLAPEWVDGKAAHPLKCEFRDPKARRLPTPTSPIDELRESVDQLREEIERLRARNHD
jgi:hypothetical protein